MEIGAIITLMALVLFTFILAIIFHELGHVIYIKTVLNQMIDYGFKDGHIYITFPGFSFIKPIHKIGISISGIFAGLVPIFYLTAGVNRIVFMCLYLIGTAHDILKVFENIFKILKNKKGALNDVNI